MLCLAGLTRNCRDFDPLLASLPTDRLIVTMDYRGRGRSQYADDWRTYHPMQELDDAIAVLDALSIGDAAVVGTSRGGIVAMLMASVRLERIAGAVLNDIGPIIDVRGLIRIARLLGREAAFTSWNDAVAALRRTSPGFDSLTDEQWHDHARRIFIERDGTIHADFDPNLAKTFPSEEQIATTQAPDLWVHFAALEGKPCAVLRGEHSDLLSDDTVQRMKNVHPGLIAVTVRDRGHVPFLDEPECVAAITAVLKQCDEARSAR